MTREEAASVLADYDINYEGHTAEEVVDAFDVAFKALKVEPCEDAISRQGLLDTIDRFCDLGKRQLKEIVRDLPSVTPKQRTGHWIKDDITERSKSAYKYKCDRCGAYHRARYDYCPSCGAKMV